MQGLQLLLFSAAFAGIVTGVMGMGHTVVGRLKPADLQESMVILQGIGTSQVLLPLSERHIDSASGNRYPIYDGLNEGYKNAFFDVEHIVWKPNWQGASLGDTVYGLAPTGDGSLPTHQSTIQRDHNGLITGFKPLMRLEIASSGLKNEEGAHVGGDYLFQREFYRTYYEPGWPAPPRLVDRLRRIEVFPNSNIMTFYRLRATWAFNIETAGRVDQFIAGDLYKALAGEDVENQMSAVFVRLPLTTDGSHRAVYTVVRWVRNA